MDEHGKVIGHIRRCRVHGEHGILYSCSEYDEDTIKAIGAASDKYRANLRSRKWCNEQMTKTGMDHRAIEIFRAMAGVDDWTE